MDHVGLSQQLLPLNQQLEPRLHPLGLIQNSKSWIASITNAVHAREVLPTKLLDILLNQTLILRLIVITPMLEEITLHVGTNPERETI